MVSNEIHCRGNVVFKFNVKYHMTLEKQINYLDKSPIGRCLKRLYIANKLKINSTMLNIKREKNNSRKPNYFRWQAKNLKFHFYLGRKRK